MVSFWASRKKLAAGAAKRSPLMQTFQFLHPQSRHRVGRHSPVAPRNAPRSVGTRIFEILGRSESALRLSKSIMQTTAHFKYQRAGGPTWPPAFSYLKTLSPAGDHSDAIPTGTSFQASTRPPARELHGAKPTLFPALHLLPASTQAPPVAGHPFPRPHSKPHSEQQKLANFSCADIINSDTS